MRRRRIPSIEGLEHRQLTSLLSLSAPAEVWKQAARTKQTTLGPRGRAEAKHAVSEGTKA